MEYRLNYSDWEIDVGKYNYPNCIGVFFARVPAT